MLSPLRMLPARERSSLDIRKTLQYNAMQEEGVAWSVN